MHSLGCITIAINAKDSAIENYDWLSNALPLSDCNHHSGGRVFATPLHLTANTPAPTNFHSIESNAASLHGVSVTAFDNTIGYLSRVRHSSNELLHPVISYCLSFVLPLQDIDCFVGQPFFVSLIQQRL